MARLPSSTEVTAASNIQLPFNYTARPYQREFWKQMHAGCKRALLVWHRRSGKDKCCWNYMIAKASQRTGTYYYFFPHHNQGRKILWDGIDRDGFKLLDHIPPEIQASINNTEMKLKLKNGSLIQMVGTNNIDAVMGTNPVGCVFSEYSLQMPSAWEYISPILRENGGWAVFNGTPRGCNHMKELLDMAQKNPKWFAQVLTADDTEAISKEDIDEERKAGMSEDMVLQEYYCSFDLGIEGSYYARYIQAAKDEERIGTVPWDTQKKVHTSWDLGYGDSTAVIFWQACGRELHLIDYIEDHGKGLAHYVKQIKDRPYIYGEHFAPHDVDSHDFSTGLSAKDVGAALGIRFVALPTLKIRVEDGIEAARGIFPRVWIDEKRCARLIKCLENYRKEWDEKKNCYKQRPRHDGWSHGADSFRYLSIAVRRNIDSASENVTDAQAQVWFEKHNPLFE